MEIRALRLEEAAEWVRMRLALWPDCGGAELFAELAGIAGGRGAVLVAADPDGELRGFVELSVRDWAEGCTSRPVAYLEGWYVVPEARRQGVGSQLLQGAEDWARSRGCREIASDAEPDNAASLAAHRAWGFREVGRAVLFAKTVEPEAASSTKTA